MTPADLTNRGVPEYGVLLSHAHEHEVIGGFQSVGFAKAHGRDVVDAQPGIEFAVMYRNPGGPWAEVITDQDAATVTRERWES